MGFGLKRVKKLAAFLNFQWENPYWFQRKFWPGFFIGESFLKPFFNLPHPKGNTPQKPPKGILIGTWALH